MVSSNSDVAITPSSSYEFYQIISSGTVFVEFVSEYCSGCKYIASTYESLANKYSDSGSKFVIVNIDKLDEVRTSERIYSVPVFYVYKSGQKVDQLKHASKDKLEDLVVRWVKE